MVAKITRMDSSPMTVATCGRKMSNGFDNLTISASPAFGYPAARMTAVITGLAVFASVYGTSLSLTTILTGEPAGPGTVEYFTDDEARKARVPDYALAHYGAEKCDHHDLGVAPVAKGLSRRGFRGLALVLHLLEDG